MPSFTDPREHLILTTEDDDWFVIPAPALEKFRASKEQRAKAEKALGDDVSGYALRTGPADAAATATAQGKFTSVVMANFT